MTEEIELPEKWTEGLVDASGNPISKRYDRAFLEMLSVATVICEADALTGPAVSSRASRSNRTIDARRQRRR